MSLRQPLAVIFLMVMAMSLLWSKALLGLTMAGLAFISIVDIQIQPFRIKFLLTPSRVKESIRQKASIWVFALFWLIYFLSILYAGDVQEWWQLTHPKFAFLLIPMSFAMLQPFTRKEYMLIMLCMIIMVVWSTIWVQVAYYGDFELLNKSLGYGASLPTPGSHIRFSVITAISMILCLGFAIENWTVKFRWERWIYGMTGVYLFYFLHILSVRSGLVIAYAGLLVLTIFYFRQLKPWKKLVLASLIIIAPILAYRTLPGLQWKVGYTLYDLKEFQKGQGDNYSDSQRWVSWGAGIDIGNRHPFFGAGTGKFRAELDTYYKAKSKEYNWRPQNQWINVFAIFGLFGLTVFLFILIYPMTISFFWKPLMLPAIYIMHLVSMMAEHALDSAVGTSLFLLTTLLGLSYQSGTASNANPPN